MNVPVVCTIGATEPWNVAGLGLDARALAACGVRAVTVVAGVTAQSRHGVSGTFALPAAAIAAQFDALAEAPIAAYRVGALLDVASLESVAEHLRQARAAGIPVVYDPVLAASAGGAFADDALVRAIAERLLPCVSVVTPNLREAAQLTSQAPDAVADVAAMAAAGRALLEFGAAAALVKGGHLGADPSDVLVEGRQQEVFAATRLPGTLRGTGCLLACALAAELARGTGLRAAVVAARAFVRERFASSFVLGGMHVAY